MQKKTLLLSLGAFAVVALTGGLIWRTQLVQQRAALVQKLPPPPDLATAPEALRLRLAEAETRARSLRGGRDGLVALSRLYHANGYDAAALRCYEVLAQLEPHEARWPHLHATILAGYGDIEPAIALFQRAAALAPDYEPSSLRLGDSLLKANRSAEATAVYERVLQKNPGQAYARFGLARLDLEAGREDAARAKLETVVRATNFQLGYDLIVNLYERSGQQAQASAIRGSAKASGAYRDPADPWADEILADCFDPFRVSVAAGMVARNGDVPAALRLLNRALELAPNDVGVRFQLGGLSQQQGDFATARAEFERCTVIAPDFADGWAHLSGLYAQMGDEVAAERTLTAGLRNCPRSPGLQLMRARSLKKAGRPDDAINAFMVSIRLRPTEPDAYIELGNLLIEIGRVDEGVAAIRESLEAEPGHPVALSTLAFHAITSGLEAEARTWMREIARQPRVRDDISARLAEAYQQQFNRPWQR